MISLWPCVWRLLVLALAMAALVLAPIPGKVLAILTVLQLVFRENFPFSHYPMYAGFSDRTYLILVTDEHDRLLAVKSVFGISANFLKGIYDRELRRHAEERQWAGKYCEMPDLARPGQRVLQFLAGLPAAEGESAPRRKLRLHHVNYVIRDGAFAREQVCVAELAA